MKTALIHTFGSPDNIRYEDTAEPVAQAHEVKVRVEAVGLNPLDLKIIAGYTQATSRCLLQSYHSAFRTRHTCEGMCLPFEQV